MAESSDFSEKTYSQGRASDMARPKCGSSEATTATMEKEPHVPSCPASTASGLNIDVDKSQPTPPTASASAPASVYSLRNRKQSKLVYDAKYHPMDDIIRPTQATKRREAHGAERVCLDLDAPSEASTIHTDAEESDNEQSEAGDGSKQPSRGKKRGLARSQQVTEAIRRSPRKVSDPKISYDMSVHPQDEFLVLSSDEEELKSKKAKPSKHERPVHKSDPGNGVGASKSDKRRHVDYVENSTDDELDSDDEHALPSVEAGPDAFVATESLATSPVATNPHGFVQNIDLTDVDSVSETTFVHDDKDAWPAQPGQPFSIFTQSLSDQLASETHAFSSLEYNDDDKENATRNNELDSDPLPTLEGFSVIPEAEYTVTSEERELSSHRALVSHALYDEPAPETYGLDSAHFTSGVGTNEFFFEAMKILTSGAHLPM